MNSGFERSGFWKLQTDVKRANRHVMQSCELAAQNGVRPEAMASACLAAAAELMLRAGGREMAIEHLRLALDKVIQHDDQLGCDTENVFRLN